MVRIALQDPATWRLDRGATNTFSHRRGWRDVDLLGREVRIKCWPNQAAASPALQVADPVIIEPRHRRETADVWFAGLGVVTFSNGPANGKRASSRSTTGRTGWRSPP